MNGNPAALLAALAASCVAVAPVTAQSLGLVGYSLSGRPALAAGRRSRAGGRRLPPTAEELRHRAVGRIPFPLKNCFRRRLISRAGVRLAGR